jgi:hypothetical protein
VNPDALCMAFGSCNGHEFGQYLWLVGMYTGIPMPYGLAVKTVLIGRVTSYKKAAQEV